MTAALLCPAAPALAQYDLTVCTNKGFTLASVADAAGVEPVTYQWYENGSPIENSNTATISIPEGEKAPGAYAYVRVAANAACTLSSNTYTVRVAKPSVTITPASAAAMTATLTAVVSECSDCRYKWSSGQTTESITVKAPDPERSASYACTVTSSAGCSATAAPATVTGRYTHCTACCWNGSAWVDCYITRYAYPFLDDTHTLVSPAYCVDCLDHVAQSDKHGYNNTYANTFPAGSAQRICAKLGTKWYLPAYEELVNMSSGTETPPLNGLAGADILRTSAGRHYSSTMWHNNHGRHTFEHPNTIELRVVHVRGDGYLNHDDPETKPLRIRCAWRP